MSDEKGGKEKEEAKKKGQGSKRYFEMEQRNLESPPGVSAGKAAVSRTQRNIRSRGARVQTRRITAKSLSRKREKKEGQCVLLLVTNMV